MESRCGAFHLLNGGDFYQHPEVPIDRPLLGVDGLGNAAQKHCGSSDVLASPSELWGVIPLIHDVTLDLAGMTLGGALGIMCMGRNVLHRRRRCRRRLTLPSLS